MGISVNHTPCLSQPMTFLSHQQLIKCLYVSQGDVAAVHELLDVFSSAEVLGEQRINIHLLSFACKRNLSVVTFNKSVSW